MNGGPIIRVDELPITESAKKLYSDLGIAELYPPQEDAVKAGVLEGNNLVLAVPTASGKTMVAELCALKHIAERRGKVLYLVPLKALASEKYEEFKKFSSLGIRVILSTGDFDSLDPKLGRYDIIIATNEKADSIFRHRPDWISSLTLLVADEIHLLGDGSRGPTLEAVITRFRIMNPKAQLLALSATVNNGEEMAGWLGGKLVTSTWRPVPLSEGVFFRDSVMFRDGRNHKVEGGEADPVARMALEVIRGGGQMLVFTGSRLSAVSLAKRLEPAIRAALKRKEETKLLEVSSQMLKLGEKTRVSEKLSKAMANGVAFHHAGLTYLQRSAVEDAFRSFLIKCICATPTLCLPEGEEVFRTGPPIGIEKLDEKDRVLGHTGHFQKVIAPTSRSYIGEILEISPYGQLPMRMTPEHKVLISKGIRRSTHSRKINRHWWEYGSPEWVEAKKLKKGDFVLFPRIKENIQINGINLPRLKPLSNQYGPMGRHWAEMKIDNLPLSEQILELLGIFVAEGCTGKNGAVQFAISSNEEELTKKITEAIASLGLKYKVKDLERHRRTVITCSKQLAIKLSDLFGKDAYSKCLPASFMKLPFEMLCPLIRGMWLGDGWVFSDGMVPMASYTTISPSLSKQLYALLVKIGFMPSLAKRKVDQTSQLKPANGSIVHRHDLYSIKISGKQIVDFCRIILGREISLKGNRTFNLNHIDENYYYLKIRKIRPLQYSGQVYNLEVKNDSSYVGSFVVHNSAGINLPARRVLIYDYRRYEAGIGQTNIPVLEEKQMAGRAGRPKYDKEGEAILLARSEDERDFLMEQYVLASPEKVWSKLGNASSLRSHILAAISTGLACSEEGVFDFLDKTFCSFQYGLNSFRSSIVESLGMLLGEGMVKSEGREIVATALGKRVAELYIDPKSAVILKNGLKVRRSGLPPLSYLTLACHTPDMPKTYVKRRELDMVKGYLESNYDLFLYDLPQEEGFDYEMLLSEVKTALLLKDWIEEASEDAIIDRFDVGSGDIYGYVESGKWLVHSSHELAKLLGCSEALKPLSNLYVRMDNGVREELVPLVSLKGVGRIRARALFSAGFATLEDLKRATPAQLGAVPTIGPETIKAIKEQLGGKVTKEEWSMMKEKKGTRQLSMDDYG